MDSTGRHHPKKHNPRRFDPYLHLLSLFFFCLTFVLLIFCNKVRHRVPPTTGTASTTGTNSKSSGSSKAAQPRSVRFAPQLWEMSAIPDRGNMYDTMGAAAWTEACTVDNALHSRNDELMVQDMEFAGQVGLGVEEMYADERFQGTEETDRAKWLASLPAAASDEGVPVGDDAANVSILYEY